jgi:hypothetical protein
MLRAMAQRITSYQAAEIIRTIKLPERQINGSSYKLKSATFVISWRSIRDNLRNFFLSPPAEMLSFLQRLEK